MLIEASRICPACKGKGWKTIIKNKKGIPCPCCGIRGYDPNPKKLKQWRQEQVAMSSQGSGEGDELL